jgi:hypothetical protein
MSRILPILANWRSTTGETVVFAPGNKPGLPWLRNDVGSCEGKRNFLRGQWHDALDVYISAERFIVRNLLRYKRANAMKIHRIRKDTQAPVQWLQNVSESTGSG